MISKVFILGNHIQALGLVRQVNKLKIPVYLFIQSHASLAKYSNSVKKTYFFKSTSQLLEKIHSLSGDSRETLLFPTNDEMVYFLRNNYNLLSKSFYVGIPIPDIVDIFYNKRFTYKFAENHKIPYPKSWFPESLDDIISIGRTLEYPVILKPAVMYLFHKTFGKKAIKCVNVEDLIEKARCISHEMPISDIIIQEFIDGGAKNLYSYGTYSFDGKPVAALMANRIRQNPMDFGNSTTFAITCNVPEIKKYAEKILGLLHYSGLAEIEFMYDEKISQFKFLEVNTRAWKWHTISNPLGFSFLGELINHENKTDMKGTLNFNNKVAWVDRFTDFSVVAKEIIKREMTLPEVLNSYKIRKEYAVWSKKDIIPFFMYLILSPYLYFKRY